VKVICNQASDDCPGGCEHAVPHNRVRVGSWICTQWDVCAWIAEDNVAAGLPKVRCTRVKGTK
jgi:hypothetical protein